MENTLLNLHRKAKTSLKHSEATVSYDSKAMEVALIQAYLKDLDAS